MNMSRGLMALLGCLLISCAQWPAPQRASGVSSASAVFEPADILHWEAVSLPGKQVTQYRLVEHEGRSAVQADAQASASFLRHKVRREADQLGWLEFEWHVAHALDGADVGSREHADAPVRVALVFEGDERRFGPRDSMLSELSRALTGEPLPYATLVYVWSQRHPIDSVVMNARTQRIRKIVVASGQEHLQQWRSYRRNIREDFERAFGEPPGPLKAVVIMTDSDNTQSRAQAWYGPIRLVPR